MATGSPVSFWYGTRAQFDSITTKLDTTLYFITDEQALYKGTVKFSGSGVDTLLTISSTQPSASSVTTGDKYFDTSDNLIHVLKNENGTVTTTATYEPANGALYYNADAQRFQTLIKDGSSYIPTEIYDAGISVEDGTGLILNGTTVAGLDATTNSKGVVQVGSNLNVSNGVVSVPVATNAVFGVVKSGSNITNNNGVLSVAKATASSLGVVKVGSNINVDNNGQISVPVANGSTKGVVSAGENVYNSDGVLSVNTATTGTKGVAQVGTNIDVNNGVISVKDASTSNKGVVQLTNDLADIHSTTLAATPNLIATVTDDLDGRKQDNMTATAPVDIENSNVSLNFGDGLTVGVAGTTNANKLIVNEATVEETLTDSRKVPIVGSTEYTTLNNITDRVVEPHDLKGALSVGQAVDVSCPPNASSFESINYAELTDPDFADKWESLTADTLKDSKWVDGFSIRIQSGSGNKNHAFYPFPKAGPNLKYLFIYDILNQSGRDITTDINGVDGITISADGKWHRYYSVQEVTSIPKNFNIQFRGSGTGLYLLSFKNWRQYEVTALTEEAINYLKTLDNPDAYFRSSDIKSIKNKYLVKQDMVCPFISTIEMSNSDLTVASGLSYKMVYSSNTAVTRTISADTIPAKAYGWDTHLQLFIDGNTTVNFQSPLVLMNPLTPNAGHNMTIKWRNGQALAYVDDTDVGYIVTTTTGTENGSLLYGLNNDVGQYIVFNSSTNEVPISIGGSTINKILNIIGNGSDKTIIDGYIMNKKTSYGALSITGISCNGSITTLYAGANISMNINDCYISGVTHYEQVAGQAAQKCMIGPCCSIHNTVFDNMNANGVTGYWGVIALYKDNGTSKSEFVDCIYKNAGRQSAHLFCAYADIKNSVFKDNKILLMGSGNAYRHGLVYNTGGTLTIDNCFFSNNYYASGSSRGSALAVGNLCTISGSTFATPIDDIRIDSGATASFAGTNIINSKIFSIGTCVLLDDCIIDLSSNTNSKVYNNDNNNAVIEAISGAQVVPYGETASITVRGTGNTLLNNGRLGFLVTAASGTSAGTLYDALINGTADNYTNIIFDPSTVTSSTTITLPDATTISRAVLIDGNGVENTKVGSVLYSNDVALQVKNLESTCCIVQYGLSAGGFYMENCYIHNTSGNKVIWSAGGQNAGVGGYGTTANPVVVKNSRFYQVAPGGWGAVSVCGGDSSNLIYGSTISNCSAYDNGGAVGLAGKAENCTFDSNTRAINIMGTGSSITNCYFVNNTQAVRYNSSVNTRTCTITGSTFATATDFIEVSVNMVATFSGTNILNSTVFGVGTTRLGADSILDLSGNTNSTVISGGTITVDPTAKVIPYGGTEPQAITGSGNTLSNMGVLS